MPCWSRRVEETTPEPASVAATVAQTDWTSFSQRPDARSPVTCGSGAVSSRSTASIELTRMALLHLLEKVWSAELDRKAPTTSLPVGMFQVAEPSLRETCSSGCETNA